MRLFRAAIEIAFAYNAVLILLKARQHVKLILYSLSSIFLAALDLNLELIIREKVMNLPYRVSGANEKHRSVREYITYLTYLSLRRAIT